MKLNNRTIKAILQLSLESNYECGILGNCATTKQQTKNKKQTILAVNTIYELTIMKLNNYTHNKT